MGAVRRSYMVMDAFDTFFSAEELVAVFRPGQTDLESQVAAVCVLAVFDHDFEWHLLVQVWDKMVPRSERRWRYALYFCADGEVSLVCDFPDVAHGDVPFVEAATVVSDVRGRLRAAGAVCGVDGGRFG